MWDGRRKGHKVKDTKTHPSPFEEVDQSLRERDVRKTSVMEWVGRGTLEIPRKSQKDKGTGRSGGGN